MSTILTRLFEMMKTDECFRTNSSQISRSASSAGDAAQSSASSLYSAAGAQLTSYTDSAVRFALTSFRVFRGLTIVLFRNSPSQLAQLDLFFPSRSPPL